MKLTWLSKYFEFATAVTVSVPDAVANPVLRSEFPLPVEPEIHLVPEHSVTGALTLLTLAGYVALLLWGMHMVSTGVMRAFGSDLRRVLGRSLRYRLNAFLVGLGVTAALQSSTATGLMATSFVASGVIGLAPALAVMLGANVGTTLIVQILSFDISLVAPILILVGVVAFRRGGRSRTRDLGRVWIGLGLILLALHLLVVTIEPAVQVPAVRAVFGLVASAPVFGVLVAACLAWVAHSSVAVVLLAIPLAGTGAIEPAAAVALVLGANLGSAINPVLEGREWQPCQPPTAGRQSPDPCRRRRHRPAAGHPNRRPAVAAGSRPVAPGRQCPHRLQPRARHSLLHRPAGDGKAAGVAPARRAGESSGPGRAAPSRRRRLVRPSPRLGQRRPGGATDGRHR